jgi:cation transport ATPase
MITELRQAGGRIASVADGVNDAIGLVTTDLGIAIGAGTPDRAGSGSGS